MTNPSPPPADLQLRGSAGPVRARVHWPLPGPAVPLLLLFFPAWTAAGGEGTAEAEALCAHLCAHPGLLVLAAPCRGPAEGLAVAEWAAVHAHGLGTDATAIALAGDGRGALLAESVARLAAVAGWPVIHRLVLIDPASPRSGVGGVAVLHRFHTGSLAGLAVAVRAALGR